MSENAGQNPGGLDPVPKAGAGELRAAGAGPASLLVAMDAVMVGRVNWAIGRIADQCWLPQKPPRPWAGREQLIGTALKIYEGLTPEDAGIIVDQAALKLWAREDEDPAEVRKELSRMRLIGIRQLALQLIRDGRTETTSKFIENPKDPTTVIEVPYKRKKFEGAGPAEIALLLNIEHAMRALDALDGKSGGTNLNVVAAIFSELDKAASQRGANSGASLAQQIRDGDIDGSSPAGVRKIAAAFAELKRGAKNAKTVKSKVSKNDKGKAEGAE